MKIPMTKEQSFEKIYRKYSDLIMKVSYNIIGSYDITQEICQTTFMEYFINMDRIDESIIKGWLMLVARNASLDYVKKASSRHEVASVETYENVEYMISEDLSIDLVVDQGLRRELIYQIIEDLYTINSSWYDVIMQVSILSKPQEEAAEYLNISVPVLRARLYRARTWIREKYQAEYEGCK